MLFLREPEGRSPGALAEGFWAGARTASPKTKNPLFRVGFEKTIFGMSFCIRTTRND